MACLVDTSILLRLVNGSDAQYDVALNAVTTLLSQGETLYLTAQSMIEFRSGATRPIANNGLGLTPQAAAQRAPENRFTTHASPPAATSTASRTL